MQAGDGQAYAGVLAGDLVTIANRKALENCRKQSCMAKKAVRCAIQIKAED